MRLPLIVALACFQFAALGEEPSDLRTAEASMISRFERQLASMKDAGSNVETHSRRGDLHLFLNQPREAVAEFEKTIALDSTQDAPHWRLGIAYYFAGEFAKSARQFEKYHAYDGRDRENGIWKYLAQARVDGIEKARREMLIYTEFDREPFPSLYEMFAGKRTGDDVLADVERKQLTGDARVMFFAHYYVGLNEELLGNRERGIEHLRKAVALFTTETSGLGGPGYMWQVARVHLQRTAKPQAASDKGTHPSKP